MPYKKKKQLHTGVTDTFFLFKSGKIISVLSLLLIVIAVPLTVSLIRTQQQLTQHAGSTYTATGKFYTNGNKIIDPSGNQFIVKGIVDVWGTFLGSSVGSTNYQNAQRDMDSIKSLGANQIRVFVSANTWNTSSDQAAYMQELDNVITWATQRSLVIELADTDTNDATLANQFIGMLASRYKTNSYVWLQPMNEPNCSPYGNTAQCDNWSYWQTEESNYVKTIRANGFTNPIVINSIHWSWDLSQIGAYPLNDNNLIYAAHRYGNNNQAFDSTQAQDCDSKWANLATTYPIIVDEVGAQNDGFIMYLTWNQGFDTYLVNWVTTRQGSGAVAEAWYMLTDNALSGDWRNNISNDVLTSWGNIYYIGYLQQVAGSPGISGTPTITSATTPTPTSALTPTVTPTLSASDATPPTVSITNPLNGSVLQRGSKVSISAAASDNVGVTKVLLYVNNSLLSIMTTAPYDYIWNVPNKPRVTYTIQAVAYDAARNTASNSISVSTK